MIRIFHSNVYIFHSFIEFHLSHFFFISSQFVFSFSFFFLSVLLLYVIYIIIIISAQTGNILSFKLCGILCIYIYVYIFLLFLNPKAIKKACVSFFSCVCVLFITLYCESFLMNILSRQIVLIWISWRGKTENSPPV